MQIECGTVRIFGSGSDGCAENRHLCAGDLSVKSDGACGGISSGIVTTVIEADYRGMCVRGGSDGGGEQKNRRRK